MHAIDLSKYGIQTDLILEQILPYKGDKIIVNEYNDKGINVQKVRLLDDVKELNKKKGDYTTISFLDATDKDNRQNLINIFGNELKDILKSTDIKDDYSCLVVGLGNKESTPDSLGPITLDSILVTRQFLLLNEPIEKGYRITSKLTPGVMGDSGIETKDIILGVIKKIKPDFMIVIDALRASNINRVLKTIQLSNTGISPGSGVGNKRDELSIETIGIPVICIGVCTVVDSASVVIDTLHYMMKKLAYDQKNIGRASNKLEVYKNYLDDDLELSRKEKKLYFGMLGELKEEEKRQLFLEVLNPIGYNLIVTPKDIDFQIKKISCVLATGINKILHSNYDIS